MQIRNYVTLKIDLAANALTYPPLQAYEPIKNARGYVNQRDAKHETGVGERVVLLNWYCFSKCLEFSSHRGDFARENCL